MKMILLSLILLFFSSAFFFWKRKIKLGGLSLMLAALICLGVGQGWATQFLFASLQKAPPLLQPQWQDRNAIIVLGGGSVNWHIESGDLKHMSSSIFVYSRLFEAARLYRNCQAAKKVCVLVISGGDPRKKGLSEAQIMQRELIQIGVAAENILIEEKSRNTFENAKFTASLLMKQSFSKLILVTSGFHLSRAMTFFSFFKLQVEGAPSDQMKADLSALPMSKNFLYADIFLREYLGFAQFRLYNFMGWN